jgi:hypothetical protein
MNKSKALRLGGFVTAIVASAALVAAASGATGAYFTGSVDGNLNGTSGSLTISATNTIINFTGLNPGVDQSKTVTFKVSSSSTTHADVWMVFDATNPWYGAFTGANNVSYGGWTTGGLGGYGHFKVVGSAGYFESYNLQLPAAAANGIAPYTSTGQDSTCFVDKWGHYGSATQHVTGKGNDLAECGVPTAILLQQDVAPGHSGSAVITFGLTGKQIAQGQINEPNVPFKIVATQPGISPVGTSW